MKTPAATPEHLPSAPPPRGCSRCGAGYYLTSRIEINAMTTRQLAAVAWMISYDHIIVLN
jgi:hypothetical protein